MKIAVVLHLFHEDQWQEFKEALCNIPNPFSLFVSIRAESSFDDVIINDFPDATILHVQNVGRDVAPLLAFLPQLQGFDVVCKLHSKRSEGMRTVWRNKIISALLGSRDKVKMYLDAFANHPDLAIGGSAQFYLDGNSHLGHNARRLKATYGDFPQRWGFFAGTMFWFRPAVFQQMIREYSASQFVAHSARDGHIEHAIERAFGLIPALQKKKIMLAHEPATIDFGQFLPSNPDWHHTHTVSLEEDTSMSPISSTATNSAEPKLSKVHDALDGYVSDKWSGNLRQYERLFSPRRDLPVRLLEIGIQNGGSLELWATYFKQAQILVGCDIDTKCELLSYQDNRINVVVADACLPETQKKIASLSEQFDIIIDDGSHRSGDIINAFVKYFPKLSYGGVFVAEDLHCSYWPRFQGGLNDPASSMAFFRALTDVINHEHWKVNVDVKSRFSVFEKTYGLEIDTSVFSEIVSIEFANSMVVVHKGTSTESKLGTRSIRGSEALVNDQVLKLRR